MSVKMGVALLGELGQDATTSLGILAAIDAHKDLLAGRAGVSGVRASLLYPAIVQLWCIWNHPATTRVPGPSFPPTVLMDGLRDRGITPLINWQTVRGYSTTTLAAASSAGATNFKFTNVDNLYAGNIIRFTASGVIETLVVQTVGTAGSGGTGVTVTTPATYAHANGATVEKLVGAANAERINAGLYDSYMATWAAAANAWRDSPAGTGVTLTCRPKSSRIIVRPDWEMNGSWFPWRAGIMGNTNANLQAKFQRMHDQIRVTGGADHVEFFYCPHYIDAASMAAQYPGADHVQWAGFDIYPQTNPATTFAAAIAATRTYTSKPIIIGETGIHRTASNDAARASWVNSAIGYLDGADCSAVCYFDMDVDADGSDHWGISLRATGAALGANAQIAYATQKLAHTEVL